MSDSDLTPRQTEILRLIQRSVQETGMPPTRKEIAEELGFKSPNAAEEHLRTLARKGVITLLPGASRGIQTVLDRAMKANLALPQAEYKWSTEVAGGYRVLERWGDPRVPRP